jgi:hypothetical protein
MATATGSAKLPAASGPEATKLGTGTNSVGVDTLAAVIAHSQIVVPVTASVRGAKSQPLPAGFGDVDIAILDWIVAEGRLLGRSIARL